MSIESNAWLDEQELRLALANSQRQVREYAAETVRLAAQVKEAERVRDDWEARCALAYMRGWEDGREDRPPEAAAS